MGSTSRLALSTLEVSQNQKEVTVNNSLHKIDALLMPVALSLGDTAPPGSPVNGDIYVIGASPTGAWTGKANNVTYYVNGWNFIAPFEGMLFWVADENTFYVFNGTAWTIFGSGGTAGSFTTLGVNATADATNKLAVSTAAVLFNHIGGSIQHKFNKNASGDSATILFQTNFSGRAEIGTAGSDDFYFKVSPDGSTFYTALILTRFFGRVINPSTNASVAAAGVNQANATQLDYQNNQIASATAGSADGVKLWGASSQGGDEAFIANGAAASVKIYPATGGQINALGTNNPLTITSGQRAILKSVTSTQWYSIVQ